MYIRFRLIKQILGLSRMSCLWKLPEEGPFKDFQHIATDAYTSIYKSDCMIVVPLD